MKVINDVLLNMVQTKIENAVVVDMLSKNMNVTKKTVEDEVIKKLVNLSDKLSELAWSE